jgi:hypothetical protein
LIKFHTYYVLHGYRFVITAAFAPEIPAECPFKTGLAGIRFFGPELGIIKDRLTTLIL